MFNVARRIVTLTFIMSAASCTTLNQIAQNLPPAETPILYPADSTPAVPAIQIARSITSRNGPLQIGSLSTPGPCPGNAGGGPFIPTDQHIVVNIFKRSLTDISLQVNGVQMRQPESDDQERWWTDDGTGYYYLDKEWGTRGEVNQIYDDERLAIVLPTSLRAVRPLNLEIRGVSNNANYTGTQKISAPLTVTIPRCPDFVVAFGTVPQLPRGGNEQVTLNVTRIGGMNQAVQLSVSGLPSNVSIAPNPINVAANSSSANATLTATNNATVGTTAITLTGTAMGLTRTATTSLRVINPDFTVAVAQIPAVKQGRQVTFTTTVTRNSGANVPVTLDFVTNNWPTGLTSVFAPQPLQAMQATSTGTITAASDVAVQSYPVTLRAQGGGITKTVGTTITVSAIDFHDPFNAVDCNCNRTGDYVVPAEPVEGNASPDGRFNLTVSPGANSIGLQLRHATNNQCMITPGAVSPHAQWAFSPHGKYFMIADRPTSNLRITFYRLGCDPAAQTPRIFESALFVPPGDEWDISAWGFSPDDEDRTFAFGALVSQNRADYTLLNMKAMMAGQSNFQRLIASFTTSSAAPVMFSPCGDVATVKQLSGTSLSFNFHRTRDFNSFATSGISIAGDSNADADAFVATDQHKLRVRRTNGTTFDQNVTANTSGGMCPAN